MANKDEKKGTYGRAVVLMSSDPKSIEELCDKLGEDYSVIADLDVLKNEDYYKIIIKKE